MKTSEVLKQAKELIKNESNWTKGAYARDADGRAVQAVNPAACKFCMLGALLKIENRALPNIINLNNITGYYFLNEAIYSGNWREENVADFNDQEDRQHEQVLSVFDEAIKLANEKEQSK